MVARIGADLANGARMGEGGRKAFLLCKGGGVGLEILADGLVVVGAAVLVGNSNDPSSESLPLFKIPDLID